jgi:two-component sensor histidine kinase
MTNQLQVVASAARIEARKPEASAQSVAAAVEAQVKFIALQNDGLPYPLGA